MQGMEPLPPHDDSAVPGVPAGFRGQFRRDTEARAVYAEGAGIGQIVPLAVAVPADAGDVVTLVRWAARERVPLVPRGSGSGMASGAIGRGVIVDLSRMRTIEPVDSQSIRVGPGALRNDVDAVARAQGLRFPVDPSSGPFATIGGMTGTNAAGAHTLQFGSMRAWVLGLDCVFADGSRAWIERDETLPQGIPAIDALQTLADSLAVLTPDSLTRAGVRKDSSGYAVDRWLASGELIDLLVGSEGTLALFVGIELRLIPQPKGTSSVLAAFASLDDAVQGAIVARAAGATACELLDRTFLDVAAQGGASDVPADAEAVLLAEVESDEDRDAASAARSLEQVFRDAGAREVRVALDAEAEHRLWELRHAASPTLARLDPALRSMQFVEDGAVPPEHLAEYVRGVRAALAKQQMRGVIFGHAGDAHVHVNPLVDTRLPDWRARMNALLDDIVALTVRLGGTLTGEHGDGRLRTPLMDRVWPAEAREIFRRVKSAADPAGLLNPGVKVPLDGARAIDAVRYDPALAPLPPAARHALDQIDRERGWSRSRLELLAEWEERLG